ncbi:hypothetical protein [Gloeothece verrucosa]|uniref:Uncharacterized protein n=1 Tax=Gloeothece verrucosa (strain PCC 7822) TaxID=497965 RepID=E0UKC2_GLOV7|nr:hypothetical protein [Gloeothece verrucosa]ADN15884.1 conserved hypothetical protein [Gloeothece verrucosa PCC 7822]
MSKRRNLKKEKAQRNQAYARQFRRKTTQTSGGWGRKNRQPRSGKPEESTDSQEKDDNYDNSKRFPLGNRAKAN